MTVIIVERPKKRADGTREKVLEAGHRGFLPRMTRRRLAVIVLYVSVVVVSTLQRGVLDHSHTTFPIFRQSYHHLVAGRDLYARYPTEQGKGEADRFKYSPTSALLFGPFALPPLPLGLLLWNAFNVLVLFLAVDRLLPRRSATWALLIIAPATLNAVQSSSSNALMAGLLVLSFISLERGQQFSGAFAIAVGALIKLFPLAGVSFAFLRPQPLRFAGFLVIALVALASLPLLVTTPHELVAQYGYWRTILTSDAVDLSFGLSMMRMLRLGFDANFANWPLQLTGTLLLLLPVALHRRHGTDPQFRRNFLCSVLVYTVLFNHQAEHQSFVIASVGLAVWYVTAKRTGWRTALLVLCVAGLDTIPYLMVWLTMQVELLNGPGVRAALAHRDRRNAGRPPKVFEHSHIFTIDATRSPSSTPSTTSIPSTTSPNTV